MDPVSTALRQHQFTDSLPKINKYCRLLIDLTLSSNLDYTLLVKDPFRLNITVPSQVENMMREVVTGQSNWCSE